MPRSIPAGLLLTRSIPADQEWIERIDMARFVPSSVSVREHRTGARAALCFGVRRSGTFYIGGSSIKKRGTSLVSRGEQNSQRTVGSVVQHQIVESPSGLRQKLWLPR